MAGSDGPVNLEALSIQAMIGIENSVRLLNETFQRANAAEPLVCHGAPTQEAKHDV
jgi:hypothetical protein